MQQKVGLTPSCLLSCRVPSFPDGQKIRKLEIPEPLSTSIEKRSTNFPPSLPVIALDNSLENVIAAARIKAVHALSYADCFAAATAIREQAPLVTGDPEFKKLGKVLPIDWIG